VVGWVVVVVAEREREREREMLVRTSAYTEGNAGGTGAREGMEQGKDKCTQGFEMDGS
jgi:hypothetical protein